MKDKEKKEFIDGFNKGYLIRKYDEELHNQLANSLKEQAEREPLLEGMAMGAEEAELEIKMDEFNGLRRKEYDKEK